MLLPGPGPPSTQTRLVLSDVLIETPGQFIETLTSSIRTERRSLRYV